MSTLAALEQEVSRCQLCELCKTRNKAVPGAGNAEADLMLVGEAPGREEDEQGLPFMGAVGNRLTKMLASNNIRREDCYITNTLKCCPLRNANPEEHQTERCLPYLHRQIEIIKPRVILAMGQFAIRAFVDPYYSTIKATRGRNDDPDRRIQYNGIPVIATYHPAYILRNDGTEHLFLEDLETCVELLSSSVCVSP